MSVTRYRLAIVDGRRVYIDVCASAPHPPALAFRPQYAVWLTSDELAALGKALLTASIDETPRRAFEITYDEKHGEER